MIIYKYPIELKSNTVLKIPPVVKWLDVQWQNNQLVVWAFVDNESQYRYTYYILPLWTGWPLKLSDMDATYIRTIQADDDLVYHFFAIEEKEE